MTNRRSCIRAVIDRISKQRHSFLAAKRTSLTKKVEEKRENAYRSFHVFFSSMTNDKRRKLPTQKGRES